MNLPGLLVVGFLLFLEDLLFLLEGLEAKDCKFLLALREYAAFLALHCLVKIHRLFLLHLRVFLLHRHEV